MKYRIKIANGTKLRDVWIAFEIFFTFKSFLITIEFLVQILVNEHKYINCNNSICKHNWYF